MFGCYLLRYLIYLDEVLLYIGAITSSISEAIFWPCSACLMVYYAKKYHPFSSRTEEQCIMEFNGIFYGMYEFNQVIKFNVLITVINIKKCA